MSKSAKLEREIAEFIGTAPCRDCRSKRSHSSHTGKVAAFEPPRNVLGQVDYKLGKFRIKKIAKDIIKAEAEHADALRARYSIGVRIAAEELERLRAHHAFLEKWLADNKPSKQAKETR